MKGYGKHKSKRNAQARANKAIATAKDFRRAARKRKGQWPPTFGEIRRALEMRADHPEQLSPHLTRVADYGERAVRTMWAGIPPKKREYIYLLGKLGELLNSRRMTDPVPNLSTLRRLVRDGWREPATPGRRANTKTFLDAKKLRDEGLSWTKIAQKLTSIAFAAEPRKAAEAIRKGVQRLTHSKTQF